MTRIDEARNEARSAANGMRLVAGLALLALGVAFAIIAGCL